MMTDTREIEIITSSMMYAGAAIVAGAIQSGTLAPFAVPDMIERIVTEAPAIRQIPPLTRSIVEEQLRGFAELVRSMATIMPATAPEPRIVGRADGAYQVVYAGRVLATCDSYGEASDWIEEHARSRTACYQHVVPSF